MRATRNPEGTALTDPAIVGTGSRTPESPVIATGAISS
jgi:hypothetical protein